MWTFTFFKPVIFASRSKLEDKGDFTERKTEDRLAEPRIVPRATEDKEDMMDRPGQLINCNIDSLIPFSTRLWNKISYRLQFYP